MGSADQVHVVLLEETRHDVGTKCKGDTTIVLAPAGDVLVGIRPEEIAEETAVGNLWVLARAWADKTLDTGGNSGQAIPEIKTDDTYIRRTHHTANLLHRIEIGAQTTVHSKDFLVDNCGNGQAVKAIGKGLPQLDVIASLALIIEAINAVDGRALVVSAQDEKVFWILDLVCEEQADRLE